MKKLDSITFDNMPSAIALVSNDLLIIKNQIQALQNSFKPIIPNEYLTRSEVADMLKCDVSTVHNWTVKGKLKKHCICNRSYYIRAQVEAAIISID
jgi:hypothetical protein